MSFEHLLYVCQGDTLFFKNTSPAIIGSYWDFGDGTADSTRTWSITGPEGRLVWSEIWDGKTNVLKIRVEELPPAMYLLHLQSARGAWSGKFIKQ